MNTLFMDDQHEIARLKTKVNGLVGCLEHLKTAPENTCCCGDPMDQHHPWGNHMPVNIVDAYIENTLKEYKREEI